MISLFITATYLDTFVWIDKDFFDVSTAGTHTFSRIGTNIPFGTDTLSRGHSLAVFFLFPQTFSRTNNRGNTETTYT